MTGKEDLFEKYTACVEIENDVIGAIDFEIMKAMKMENDSLAKELTKYKRAFEILKKKDVFELEESVGKCKPTIWTYGKVRVISQEEYELLEELMKSE